MKVTAERDVLRATFRKNKHKLRANSRELHTMERVREIIRIVAAKTQENLQYHISDITSLAMQTVFPKPYEITVDFVQRRNKTECDIMFMRGNTTYDPLQSSGGGVVDVASFALRVAAWSLTRNTVAPTLILDEPFKFTSPEYIDAAANMLSVIAKQLNVQFIIVTHKAQLTTYADKLIRVTQKNKISKIN